jgi:phosphoserine/homoserine phosphotransferase
LDELDALPGAIDFLEWLKPIVPRSFLITDGFEEYALPICERLGHPMVFCNFVEGDKEGYMNHLIIRLKSQKLRTVEELQRLNFRIIAVGASFNDIGMLKAADEGMFFNPSASLSQAYPEIPMINGYGALKKKISEIVARR